MNNINKQNKLDNSLQDMLGIVQWQKQSNKLTSLIEKVSQTPKEKVFQPQELNKSNAEVKKNSSTPINQETTTKGYSCAWITPEFPPKCQALQQKMQEVLNWTNLNFVYIPHNFDTNYNNINNEAQQIIIDKVTDEIIALEGQMQLIMLSTTNYSIDSKLPTWLTDLTQELNLLAVTMPNLAQMQENPTLKKTFYHKWLEIKTTLDK